MHDVASPAAHPEGEFRTCGLEPHLGQKAPRYVEDSQGFLSVSFLDVLHLVMGVLNHPRPSPSISGQSPA